LTFRFLSATSTEAGSAGSSAAVAPTPGGLNDPTVQEADVYLERVTKRFSDVVAVDDLSLQIGQGEFFSLLGPSGCGKTTTLRMIGGFEEPTLGTIYLRGRDVTDLPAYRRNVNTVFQSYALFPHLNVFDNVAFGLRRKKVERHDVERRVQETLHLVGLSHLERRKPLQLSGGQQQRVALARALVNHPQVLLLDEPLGALDLKLRKQMQLELKRIQDEVGITFVYVTHDQEEAMTMSNRIAVMEDGRIRQVGEPEDVYERPRTEYVAGFLGASNLLEGRVESRGPEVGTIVVQGGSTVRVPLERLEGSGAIVKVGVRPEKIRLEREEGPILTDWNAVSGLLRMSSFVGVSHQYTIEGPGGKELTVYAQNDGAENVPHPGERVRLLWRPEHTFVVAADTPDERAASDGEEADTKEESP
jgi:spermidine/putrescine transport system ATP-binding protein